MFSRTIKVMLTKVFELSSKEVLDSKVYDEELLILDWDGVKSYDMPSGDLISEWNSVPITKICGRDIGYDQEGQKILYSMFDGRKYVGPSVPNSLSVYISDERSLVALNENGSLVIRDIMAGNTVCTVDRIGTGKVTINVSGSDILVGQENNMGWVYYYVSLLDQRAIRINARDNDMLLPVGNFSIVYSDERNLYIQDLIGGGHELVEQYEQDYITSISSSLDDYITVIGTDDDETFNVMVYRYSERP